MSKGPEVHRLCLGVPARKIALPDNSRVKLRGPSCQLERGHLCPDMARQASALLLIRAHFSKEEIAMRASLVVIMTFRYSEHPAVDYFLKAAKFGKASCRGSSPGLPFPPSPRFHVDSSMHFEMTGMWLDFVCLESHTLYSVCSVCKNQNCLL